MMGGRLCVDLSRRPVPVVCVGARGRVRAAALVEAPSGPLDAVAARIADVARERGMTWSTCAVGLGAEGMLWRPLSFPRRAGGRLAQAVELALEQELPTSLDGLATAWRRTWRIGAQHKVLAAAVDRERVRATADAFCRVGLAPCSIWPAQLGLAPMAALGGADALVMDLRGAVVDLVAVAGGEGVFVRSECVGDDAPPQEAPRRIAMWAVWCRERGICAPTRIVWAGRDKGRARAIAEDAARLCGLEVSPAPPPKVPEQGDGADASMFCAAVGLAAVARQRGPGLCFASLRGGARRGWSPTLVAACAGFACVSLAGMLGADIAVHHRGAAAQVEAMHAAVHEALPRLSGRRSAQEYAAILRARRAGLRAGGATEQGRVLGALVALSRCAVPGAQVRLEQFFCDGEAVRCTVRVEGAASAKDVARALEASPDFAVVRCEAAPDGRGAGYRLTAQLRGAP
ncbi:hypothetical protein [Desulfobaculum senezii]